MGGTTGLKLQHSHGGVPESSEIALPPDAVEQHRPLSVQTHKFWFGFFCLLSYYY